MPESTTSSKSYLLADHIAADKRYVGIGRVAARKLHDAFGDTVHRILVSGDIDPLLEVLDEARATTLISEYKVDTAMNEVIAWMSSHGFDRRLARKVINVWGEHSVERLSENPYQLLAFLPFSPVDKVASRLGYAQDHKFRMIAGVEAALYDRVQHGHTLCDRSSLINDAARILGCSTSQSEMAIEMALKDNAIATLGDNDSYQASGCAAMESFIAHKIELMQASDKQQGLFSSPVPNEVLISLLDIYDSSQPFRLTAEQRDAVIATVNAPVSLISGGAGTGKTSALKALHYVCEDKGKSILQMALSGRAAMRMREATNRPAYTIASVLAKIKRKQLSLGLDTIILIDEASMVDLSTLYRIFRFIPSHTKICMIGDPMQLPPIGMGAPFHELLTDSTIPAVRLSRVMRQKESTGIPSVADGIRNGLLTQLPHFSGSIDGVSLLPCSNQDIVSTVIEAYSQLLGTGDVQIIAPLKSTVEAINLHFHRLCAGKQHSSGYFVNEPVMWTRNDYRRDLVNGAMGTIDGLTPDGQITAKLDGIDHKLSPIDLEDLILAYAITVHKSQGSQWDRVIVPISKSRIIDRSLAYTAITRAAKQVVIVGDIAALNQAVASEAHADRRKTGLIAHRNQNFRRSKTQGIQH